MKRHYWGISLAALLLAAFVLVQPMQMSYGMTFEEICEQISEQVSEEECLTELNEMRDARAAIRNGNGNVTVEDISTLGVPEFDGCLSVYTNLDAGLLVVTGEGRFPPEDGISMNTVRSGNIVKTIHAEKEVYLCKTAQGNIPVLVDVTVIGEIYEDVSTKSIINRQAEVITCMKIEETGQVIGCETESVPADPTIVRNCFEDPFFILDLSIISGPILTIPLGIEFTTHPQEMNTVNKGSIVKTIEAQKEIFICNLDPSNDFDLFNLGILLVPFTEKKVDVVTFIEIWEDLSLLPTDPIVKKTVESFRCVTSLGEDATFDDFINPLDPKDNVPRVESCKFTSVPVQELEE